MNDVFSLHRFKLLWRSYWIERWQEFAFVLVVAAISTGLMFITLYMSEDDEHGQKLERFTHFSHFAIFYVSLFITGALTTVLYFRPYTKRGADILILQNSASQLEKTLFIAFILLLVVPIAVFIVFSTFSIPISAIAQHFYVYTPCPDHACDDLTDEFRTFIPFISAEKAHTNTHLYDVYYKKQWVYLSYYSCLVGTIAFCHIYFKRFVTLTTAAIIFALYSAITSSRIQLTAGFWGANPEELNQYTALELIVSIPIWILLPLGIWTAVFYGLKGRQL